MPLDSVRNLQVEKQQQSYITQKLLSQTRTRYKLPYGITDVDIRRSFKTARTSYEETNEEKTKEYKHNFTQTVERFKLQDAKKGEPFQFFTELKRDQVPRNRLPVFGIGMLDLKYHKSNPVIASEKLPETGYGIHEITLGILKHFPGYIQLVQKYCRPLGTTDATFSDFNKEQTPHAIPHPERVDVIIEMIKYYFDAKPYRPLHFCDTRFCKMPSSTGTGYYNRHHYNSRAHARYSRPEHSKEAPTKKEYFYNTTLHLGRTIVHNIKYRNIPARSEKMEHEHEHKMRMFFLKRVTLLFTRNHISPIAGPWKQRPVYGVDDLFLIIELMLTFPLLIGARRTECSILYGLETIRGGMHIIDRIAQRYQSYATLDYSGFDQRAPRCIIDTFYTTFLPQLIIINHGYQPTYEYMTTPAATRDKLGLAMSNLLAFLHTWYHNMVFVTQDGYAYTRMYAGVPSGMLNTQYLDSYVNLFMMLDALLDYGLTPVEILDKFFFFLMGDDNTIFYKGENLEFFSIIQHATQYIEKSYGSKFNEKKCTVSPIRTQIEVLGYTCNAGTPTRSIEKLLAQLVYPEHGTKKEFMSYRALGIAIAAAGQDEEFHQFCLLMFYAFHEWMAPPTEKTLNALYQYTFKFLAITETFFENYNFKNFPTIEETRQLYLTWQGPLDYTPRWDIEHFACDPDPDLPQVETLASFRNSEGINVNTPFNYFPLE